MAKGPTIPSFISDSPRRLLRESFAHATDPQLKLHARPFIVRKPPLRPTWFKTRERKSENWNEYGEIFATSVHVGSGADKDSDSRWREPTP